MKKCDLECGNVVETRKGLKYLVAYGHNDKVLVNLISGIWVSVPIKSCYKEDLTNVDYFGIDIMKVYKDYTCKKLLWERKEKPQPKLTEDEKAILRNVPQYYKWIARDGNGVVCLYPDKPHKSKTIWDSYGALFPFHHLFQFIKWEDDEPYLIEDLLEGE